MNWNDIDGSYLFSKVFSKPVEINEIVIFDIQIDCEGSTVIITFDLINELPDNPPVKWVKGYNRCRCGINCGGVSVVSVAKLGVASANMRAKIRIEKNTFYNNIIIYGPEINLHLNCFHIQFMGPSVYISN